MSKPITLDLNAIELHVLANWASVYLAHQPVPINPAAEQKLALRLLEANEHYMTAALAGEDPGGVGL